MLHEYRVVESRHFGMVIELQAGINIPKAFHMLVGSVFGAGGRKFHDSSSMKFPTAVYGSNRDCASLVRDVLLFEDSPSTKTKPSNSSTHRFSSLDMSDHLAHAKTQKRKAPEMRVLASSTP